MLLFFSESTINTAVISEIAIINITKYRSIFNQNIWLTRGKQRLNQLAPCLCADGEKDRLERVRKMGETAYECGLKEEVSRPADGWMVMLFSHEI